MLLLDANVLLGLAWPNHQFHRSATERMERCDEPWATCAVTQLAFVRISANPAFNKPAKTPAEAVALLAEMMKDPGHRYIGDLGALPADGSKFWNRVHGHQEVTDAYLLRVAGANDAVLLTFDGRLKHLAKTGHIEFVVP